MCWGCFLEYTDEPVVNERVVMEWGYLDEAGKPRGPYVGLIQVTTERER